MSDCSNVPFANGTPHTDVFFPSACVYLLFSDSSTQSAGLAARRHHPCPGRSTADGVGWSESVDNPPQLVGECASSGSEDPPWISQGGREIPQKQKSCI